MDNILGAKEMLQQALKDQIAKKVAEIILPKYPDAGYVQWNPNAEYNDQDDEYYAETISIEGINGNTILDVYELDYELDLVETLVNEIRRVVDGRDFVFAYDYVATIDLRPYREDK